MKNHHTQCKFKKGNEITYSWIPSEFASIGCYINLKENVLGGTAWENDWEIVGRYNEMPSAIVIERSQDYKKTRKASDI